MLTLVVAAALVGVGVGADALSTQVAELRRSEPVDNVARAAELLSLSEREIEDLRDRGVAWSLIRQAADIVAAEDISIDEALDRIREDLHRRSSDSSTASDDTRAGDRRNDGGGQNADQADRIAEATGFPVFEIRQFQLSTGLEWDEVRRIATLASREALTLEVAAERVDTRTDR